jgi:hypothetical protein
MTCFDRSIRLKNTDAVTEASVLRDQLAKAVAPPTEPSPQLDDAFAVGSPALSASESLLDVPLPSKIDLQATDLTNDVDSPTLETIRAVERASTSILPAPSSPRKAMRSPPPPLQGIRANNLARSTLNSPSTVSPSRLPAPSPRRPLISSNTAPNLPSTLASASSAAQAPASRRLASAASTNSLVTRSKGMQMVSDMRSRVKVLEQRIQNRVPRMRKAGEAAPKSAVPAPPVLSSISASTSKGGSASAAAAAMALKMQQRDREREKEKEKRASTTTTTTSRSSTSAGDGDSPGWVLVTTGSEEREREREKNRDQSTLRASASSSSRPISSATAGGRDYVTSPTTSTASSARHSSSSTTATAPPSSYRRSSNELTSSTSHQESNSGHQRSGGGLLGVSSAASGLRPPSALGLRRSVGPTAPGSSSGIDLNASTASTIRPLTPTMLPSMSSSSTVSSSSTETSSASGLRRSTSVKSSVPSSSSSDGPVRRSSLSASTILGQSSVAGPTRPRTGLGQSTSTNHHTTNNATTIPSGSVRGGRAPSTTIPSRPAIPSMLPPTPISTNGTTAKATSLSASTATRIYSRRGPSPIPPSSSLSSSGIPQPPRPGSNLGMASKNAFMGSGLGLGKSMIGRPTSLPLSPSSGMAGANGAGIRGAALRNSNAAGRVGTGALDDDDVY